MDQVQILFNNIAGFLNANGSTIAYAFLIYYAFIVFVGLVIFGLVIYIFFKTFSGMRNFDRPRKNWR